ncbi:unnamed protein product [Moneuplotes crassus]|uniref:Major facilitator superfamily (MFS) profile domain-containing protein n=1 Tax=Euplotes crassus TaxID=5936 RepID=A0AAD1UMB1_EUPCR|nr:unnamed protein product [Moneuplotes crassus]
MDTDKKRGFLCVIGGTIMHLYLGCFYLWGNIQVYITSYLHKHDPSITLGDTSIVFPIQTITQSLCMPIGPLMMEYLPPWCACFIGGVIGIGGVFLSSYVTNLYAFIFLYPVLFGIAIGFSYMVPVVCGWEYFPQWKGAVSGVIVAGFGFGSFIFGFVSIAIANPDGEQADLKVEGGNIFSPESPVSSNAPRMLRINCIIWSLLLLTSLFMIKKNKKGNFSTQTPNLNNNKSISNQNAVTAPPISLKSPKSPSKQPLSTPSAYISKPSPSLTSDLKEPTLVEAFKDYRAYYIWLIILLSSSYPYFIASNFKTYEQVDIHDDRFITLVGALGAVVNGLSRGFWATLQDFFGFKRVFTCLLVLEITIAFTFVAVHKVKFLYLIWVLISFSTLGGHFSMIPTLCAKIFGPNTGGKIFGFIFTGFGSATLIGWFLTKAVSHDKISYDSLFYILGFMAGIALVMVFFLKDNTIVQKISSNSRLSHEKEGIELTQRLLS